MSDDNRKPRFKGHEKFTLRDGWLNKGIEAVIEERTVFLGTEGTDKLGVGNNMVKSIRYWLKVFGLTREIPGNGAELTILGQLIYKNDRYFENNFTLWILHSNIVKNMREATTWYMFFNKFEVDEFSKEEVKQLIIKEVTEEYGRNDFPENSVKDDLDVLLNMYCKDRAIDYDPEDKNVSPLAILGLVSKNREIYIRKQPDLRLISEWVVLYELQCLLGEEESISIDRIAEGENSLGSIYNLSRVAINNYLDKLENLQLIKVVRTAGLDMIYKTNKFTNSGEIIENYYKEHK